MEGRVKYLLSGDWRKVIGDGLDYKYFFIFSVSVVLGGTDAV